MSIKKQFENNGYIDPNDENIGINKGQEFLETDALFADDINKVVSNIVHFHESIGVINESIDVINDNIIEIDDKIDKLDLDIISEKVDSLSNVSVVTNGGGLPGAGAFPQNPKVGDIVLKASQYLYGKPGEPRMSVYSYNGTEWFQSITVPQSTRLVLDYTLANLNIDDIAVWEIGITGPVLNDMKTPDDIGSTVFARWNGAEFVTKMIIPKEPVKVRTFAIISTNSSNNFCVSTLSVPTGVDALQWFKDLISGSKPIQVSGTISGNTAVAVSGYNESMEMINVHYATGQGSTLPIYGVQELS